MGTRSSLCGSRMTPQDSPRSGAPDESGPYWVDRIMRIREVRSVTASRASFLPHSNSAAYAAARATCFLSDTNSARQHCAHARWFHFYFSLTASAHLRIRREPTPFVGLFVHFCLHPRLDGCDAPFIISCLSPST